VRADLGAYLGSKEHVSEVLNHKRKLSLHMIRKLRAGLGIPVHLLIGKQAGRAATKGNGGVLRVFRHDIQRIIGVEENLIN
jgi:hypothetical protein